MKKRQGQRWGRVVLVAIAVIAVALFTIFFRRAQPVRPNLPALPPITHDDRILILAPHEDDETLGAGGVILKALSVGAAVRVVYLTYGDHNQLAFIAYRKRPWLSPKVNKEMGKRRRLEAIAAMESLGLPEDHLVFLGFPDNGTLDIWKKHWGEAPPLHSILTDTTHVPYETASCYGKPYKGEEIVAAIEEQLTEFRPTRIIVTHPVDGNPDHRSYYLFLQVALMNLGKVIPSPAVYAYPIHMGPWPRPHWYHPKDWLSWPGRLARDDAPSWIFELPPAHVQSKYGAIRLYKSQMADCDYWLTTFARRNELFTTPQPILLGPGSPGPTPQSPAVPTGETAAYEETGPTYYLSGVSYSGSQEGLHVRVVLRRPAELKLGVSIHAFGYRHDTPFPNMPKIHIDWVFDHIRARDRDRLIPHREITMTAKTKEVNFTIPWKMLGNPEIIFAQTRGVAGGTPVSQTAWEVLTNANARRVEEQ